MDLSSLIDRRKTTRSFSMNPVSEPVLQDIRSFIGRCHPLVPGLRFRAEIIGIDAVRCILPWKTPHYIAIFTEDAPLALENVGFIFQQAELYIQSLGLGTCWLGMGIALSHLYLSRPEDFQFFSAPQPPSRRGCAYIGSFRL